MTDALVVGGMPVLVRPGSSGELFVMGEVTRGQRGKVRDSRRASTSGKVRLQDRKYTSSLLTRANSVRLQQMLEGDGHYWNFASTLTATAYLASSAALPATYIPSGTSRMTDTPKYGTSYLRTSTIDVVAWRLPSQPSGWTLMGWTRVTGATTWQHVIQRSDSVRWTGGVKSSAAPTTMTVVGGEVKLGALGAAHDFDDVVYLPYTIDDAWVAGMYALHSAGAWTSLPTVKVTGERFATAGVTGRFRVTAVRHEAWTEDGVWTEGEELAFTFMEE